MGSQFSRQFNESYLINEVIDEMIREGQTVFRLEEIERRLRLKDIDLEPNSQMLSSAIEQAVAETQRLQGLDRSPSVVTRPNAS